MDARYTVLLAEDEGEASRILSTKLREEGFEVHVCKDGREATESLQAGPVDCIVLDLSLPVKDGFAILREIKGTPNARTPVYVLTGFSDAEHRMQAARLGVRGYFVKMDTSLATFVKRILGDLEHRSSGGGTAACWG